MERNKIAVLILNYNSWSETIEVSKKLVSDFNIPWKDIIIVDNCSSDDSRIKLKENIELGYTYLESEKNGGYGYGNNIGLRYAKDNGYDYVWITNNDIIVNDLDYLNKIFKVFNSNSDIAVVNSDIKSIDGYLYNRESKKPSFYDYTFGLLQYRKTGRQIIDLGGYGYIYRPQGCSMVVDIQKMSEVDYFDENTFLYYEESILAERLLSKGYKCCCLTETSIIHNHSKIVKDNIKKRNFIKINNTSFAYYLKNYRNFNTIQIAICKLFNSIKLWILD